MEVIKNVSDAELVERLRNGDRVDETIRILYRDHYESLTWYVQNNSGNRQDAEDIFQEVIVTFINLVDKNRFRGESSIRTFLFSLNRHMWLNEIKRRGRASAREEKFEKNREQELLDVSHHMMDREGREEVLRLVEQLGEACRKILLLFYYENHSMKDILEQMHYENEQVVRNKKYKCLKQLEKMIHEKPAIKQTLKNLLHG
jgi:RNA polymerase sigma factor (sigma-70 family)